MHTDDADVLAVWTSEDVLPGTPGVPVANGNVIKDGYESDINVTKKSGAIDLVTDYPLSKSGCIGPSRNFDSKKLSSTSSATAVVGGQHAREKVTGKEAVVTTSGMSSPFNQQQPAAAQQNDDVILERENSAWDVLEERFQQSAADGRYLDLTEDHGTVHELGVSDAVEAFAATDLPVDPSTIVHTEEPPTEEHRQTPLVTQLLAELGTLINTLVEKLKTIREKLLRGAVQDKKEIMSINRLSKQLQKFVNHNSDAVMESGVAVRRIEGMNLLICKANTLITAYNDRTTTTSRLVIQRKVR